MSLEGELKNDLEKCYELWTECIELFKSAENFCEIVDCNQYISNFEEIISETRKIISKKKINSYKECKVVLRNCTILLNGFKIIISFKKNIKNDVYYEINTIDMLTIPGDSLPIIKKFLKSGG